MGIEVAAPSRCDPTHEAGEPERVFPVENPITLNRGVTCNLRPYTPIFGQLTHGPSDLPHTPLTAPSSSDSRRTGDGAGPGCGSRSASGGHIGSCGQASLCPGSGAGGGHDRFPSRSRKADRRQHAPERRRARSEGEGPIPYGSRTRIAAARRRASLVADDPRRGQASPLQLSLPKGQGASPKSRDRQAAGNFVTPSLTVGRTSLLRIARTERRSVMNPGCRAMPSPSAPKPPSKSAPCSSRRSPRDRNRSRTHRH